MSDKEEEKLQLNEATERINLLLANLENESKKANQQVDQIEDSTIECESLAKQILKEREQVERELEPFMPALHSALQAIDSIKQQDIIESKTSRSPPQIIRYVFDSVLVLLKARLMPIFIGECVFNKKEGKSFQFLMDSYEESGRQTIFDNNFMKKLKQYEKEQINEETIELLEPYLNQSEKWFNETLVASASMEVAAILKWVMAIVEFHQKSKFVKPKLIKLALAEGRLRLVQQYLEKMSEDLVNSQDNIKGLKERLSKQMEEKNQLEMMKAAKTKEKVNTA